MRILLTLIYLSLCTFNALASQPKNVIFILADDLGWNDTSIYQPNQFYETPAIDALAQKGMIFTHAYSNSPLCSPTRASILTGQTPARHGILNPNINTNAVRLRATARNTGPSDQPSVAPLTATRLDTSLPTLAKVLKNQHYQTAHFGKWHLGSSPYSPLEHGFDIDVPHFSGAGPEGGYLAPWSFAPNLKPELANEHIDIRLAKEAKKWILDKHKEGAFYLNFWPFSVHAPFNAKQETINHFVSKRSPFNSQRSVTYAAMVKHFDDTVAILYSALEEAEIENDTIIIFTSDNGGNMYDVLGEIHPTSNFPLRGGKATQYAGGNRIPTFIVWPGLTQPNTLSSEPIQTADFYPTLLKGLGAEIPKEHAVDGADIRPLLTGEKMDARPIFTYYPTMPLVPNWLPPSATVVYKDWKLIKTFYYGQGETHRYALYHISEDTEETTNLAVEHPDKLIALDVLLTEHLASSNAPLPVQNSEYLTGTFNFNRIGKPDARYLLPEQKVASELNLNVTLSKTIANAGDAIDIDWELQNIEGLGNVVYKQFMGPALEISNRENGFTLIAPEVYTKQFISFAFIAKDNRKMLRKQIAIEVLPVNSAPSISINNNSLNATAGGMITIAYTLDDKNKDRLTLHASSSALALDDELDVTLSSFDILIPSTFSDSEVEIDVVVSDGQASETATATIRVTQPVTVTSPGKNQNTQRASGSGGLVYLLPMIFVALWLRKNTANSRTLKK